MEQQWLTHTIWAAGSNSRMASRLSTKFILVALALLVSVCLVDFTAAIDPTATLLISATTIAYWGQKWSCVPHNAIYLFMFRLGNFGTLALHLLSEACCSQVVVQHILATAGRGTLVPLAGGH